MSDSTTNLATLTAQTANNETRVNELVDALSPASVYGRDASTTTGLTWGYYGGRYGGASVANGTVALTGSATNYVVASRSTFAVSVSTSTTNWGNAADYLRLYSIVAGSATVTSYQDHRAGPLGSAGPLSPPAAVTVASASTIAIPIGQKVVEISGTTNITSITATGHSGAVVVLIFQGVLTLTDGSNLKLGGNFVTTADDAIVLACNGTNWYQAGGSSVN